MPLDRRTRIKASASATLDLPPPFRTVRLREVGDAFAHACANAAELRAGALVHVGRFDVAEFAVVLEPDEPLATARRAFYAGMAALGDALGALAPPERPVAIEWPDALFVDGGLVGGGRLAWPENTADDAIPAWLVFGAMIRVASMTDMEAGLHPLATALEDEGFGAAASDRLVEGFARHVMVAIDRWREDGFDALAATYLSRLRFEPGARCALDDLGNLLVRRPRRSIERRVLRSMLEMPSWLDPDGGGPRR